MTELKLNDEGKKLLHSHHGVWEERYLQRVGDRPQLHAKPTFGGLLTDPSFQQAPGLDRLSHTREDQSKIQTYAGFPRIGVQGICWPTLQGQLRMGSYESLSTMDSLQAWTQPDPLSSLDTSMDLVYLACGAYGSSLHLERHHSQHHRPLHIHCLQGLPP